MRRLPVILLLIVYALTSSGFTLRAEFCCGAIQAIHLDARRPANCDPAKMKHTGKGTCCQQTEVAMELSVDQQPASVQQEVLSPALLPPLPFSAYITSSPLETGTAPLPFDDPSPPVDQQVLLCVYRI